MGRRPLQNVLDLMLLKRQLVLPVLKTLELWISRSMLDLIFSLIYPEKCIKFNQWSGVCRTPKKPIRSREILDFTRHLLREILLVGIW